MIMRYRKVVDDHNICDTQKCIEVVDPSYCQFVLDAFKNKVQTKRSEGASAVLYT